MDIYVIKKGSSEYYNGDPINASIWGPLKSAKLYRHMGKTRSTQQYIEKRHQCKTVIEYYKLVATNDTQ